jgi:hypothetical protein
MDSLNVSKPNILFTEPYESLLVSFLEDFATVIVLSCHILKSCFYQAACFSSVIGYSLRDENL